MQTSRKPVIDGDRFEALANSLDETIFEFDGEGTFINVWAPNEKLLLRPRQELIGHRAAEFLGESFVQPFLEAFRQSLDTGHSSTIEYSMQLDGGLRWFSARIGSFRSVDGNSRTVCMLARDITDRKLSEKRLADSELRLRTMLESEPECVKLVAMDGTLLDMNAAGLKMIEADSAEEVLGKSVFDVVAPEYREIFVELNKAVFRGESSIAEFDIIGLKGARLTVESHACPLRNAEGCIVAHLAVTRDITQRKHAEERLRESHSLLKAIVEQTSDGIYVKDAHGRYLMANRAVTQIMEKPMEEVVGRDDTNIFTLDTAKEIMRHGRRVMSTGEPAVYEAVLNGRSTRRVLFTEAPHRDSQGNIIGLIGICRDITEYKRLEEQFLQLQKIEAVGRLAGGVAHDFNNILTIISGYSEVALHGADASDPNNQYLHGIKNAAHRAAALTRQLLAFSSRQVLVPKVLDLNAVVADTLEMLERVIGEDVDLIISLDPALRRVVADPAQITQVILNLVVNARDAMSKGGKLTIGTVNMTCDEREARRVGTLQPGDYVMLSVQDTGCGMDDETLRHIFEPFFTTKEVGKGVGLGLSTVYGIVKQSGGDITAESVPGRGTTFQIYLPGTDQLPEPVESISAAGRPLDGSETVLLVEDEDDVREFVRRALKDRGYKVLEARNGLHALQLVHGYSGKIHLVLTDIVMPLLGGIELTDQLSAIRPNIKTLYMSGYAEPASIDLTILNDSGRFLPKPFTIDDLTRKLRELLD